jgi:D-xylose transport system substrate-binding protein
VLVLDPVDSASAASIVSKAKARNVPVISYDRLITGADLDYYTSFDNVEVGRLQARSLASKLKADGEGLGDDRDDQRVAHRQQRQVVQAGRPQRARLQRPEDRQGVRHAGWSPDQVQTEME